MSAPTTVKAPTGYIDLERSVDSIRVGNRHRQDMGDLDALIASIERDGLLQPITITPDGLLVCGARRLAAVRQLGWKKVNVWVRSSISDRLAHLLAEQDDNVLHKELTPLEAEALYREIKQLLVEDASRRQAASRFSTQNQPRSDGGSKFDPPSESIKRTREQAAAMIPGVPSDTTLDKITYLRDTANNAVLPEELRQQAAEGLAQIDAGSAVHPIYQNIRAALDQVNAVRDTQLHQQAEEAMARVLEEVKTGKKHKSSARRTPGPTRFAIQAFNQTWGHVYGWWEHYDLNVLAKTLTDEQAQVFYETAEKTAQAAAELRALRGDPPLIKTA
ncbi:ParB N-terminal domain-containing protein [Actinomycetaceae bacterium MB13-C1-2]|nr:ParB N-terminal domain-containing protein [Actinomycetaceae bacterium MB13-C1-2]